VLFVLFSVLFMEIIVSDLPHWSKYQLSNGLGAGPRNRSIGGVTSSEKRETIARRGEKWE